MPMTFTEIVSMISYIYKHNIEESRSCFSEGLFHEFSTQDLRNSSNGTL